MRMPPRLGSGEGGVSGKAIDTCTRLDPPGYGARHVGRVMRVMGETRVDWGWQPLRRTGGGSDGSRRGPYDRGGQVMLAEERALTSGALWTEPRIGDWR